MLFYPNITASGALVELGFALAQHKNCIIWCKNRTDLPSLVQDWETSSYDANSVRIIAVDNFDDVLKEIKKDDYQIFRDL
jgi:hypothetical protein